MYFDEFGLLHPKEGELSDNGILFLSQYYHLRSLDGNLPNISNKINNLLCLMIVKQKFRKLPGTTDEHWSHDNHTGMVTLSKLFNLEYHKKIAPDWYKRAHPRDLIFYAYMSGGWKKLISYLFLPILSAIMIVGFIQRYKVRNGQRFLKTDGRLLSWLRLQHLPMPITKFIGRRLMKQQFGSWKNVFIYYFGKDHPNASFMEEIYERSIKI